MITKLKKPGFTLVEVLVIISITGLILPTLFGIIFTLLRLQFQVSQLTRLKETGDFITNQIAYTIRENAGEVNNADCSSIFPIDISNFIAFKDLSGKCFGYYLNDTGNLYLVAALDSSVSSGTTSSTLINGSDTDFPVLVESAQMDKIESNLAKFKLVLKTEQTVTNLPAQKLSYQFYTYIRKRN